jgi:hypothetical protein
VSARRIDELLAELGIPPAGTAARLASPMTGQQAIDLVHLGHSPEPTLEEYRREVRAALLKAAVGFRAHGRLDAAQRAEITIDRLDHLYGVLPLAAAAGARHC